MDELTPKKQLEEQMKLAGIDTIYKEEDKAPIVEFIKDYIQHNGYVNTRYATNMTIKDRMFSNNEHRDAFYESISAMLVNTGKYIRELNKNEDKGYNILLNPNYFYNESIKSGNRTTRFIAATAVGISLFAFIKSIISDVPNKPTPQKVDIQIQYPAKDKEALRNALQKIDYLDRRIKEMDSLYRK